MKVNNFSPIKVSRIKRSWVEGVTLAELWERRLFWLKVLLFVFFGLIWLRVFYLQVVKHPYYANKAKARSIAGYMIKAPRGEILTADGVVVATNRAIFQLYIDLENLSDEESILKKLSLLLPEDYGKLKEHFYLAKRSSFGRILLKRNLTWDQVARIMVRQYYLPGVSVEVEAERFYPYGEAYFHLLGYVAKINREEFEALRGKNYSPEDLIGKKGLERLYESHLKGQNGRIEMERDAKGRLGRVVGRVDPLAGEDLIITVRHDLQMKAYELLKEKRGAIVALSPESGAILALVSMPAVDPNKFIIGFEEGEWEKIAQDPRKPLLNRALQAYPPGSTYKLITALAGLKAGIVKGLHWSVACSGYYPFGNHVFRCWEKRGHGPVSLIKAIAVSCDVYFYTIGSRLDIDLLAEVSRAFGLGRLTGLGFPEEKPGLVPDKAWKKKRYGTNWNQGETVVISIGQGYILTTPLQMARAYMVLANGGFLYKPYIVSEVRKKDGTLVFRNTPQAEGKVEIDPQYLEWLRAGLREAVDVGTGKASRVPGILVWGKTGTAQVVALHRKTRHLEHHAWFVSYAGNSTPQIVSAVLIEHGGGGGAVAAPLAGELYRAFYKLPPQFLPKPVEDGELPTDLPGGLTNGNQAEN
ncbi:MAG: penicillin-binding protein 2 [Caldimicrobium sp.]|nr:penicillin-binding protein 2 [Caldimicrobium sp.]MCX7873279.1 penicillin-binding protein 2 [Caldimicrobium sp.]MDW8094735.1 penicillin-binding protein 2 [Caldimicrobium sp.]